MGGDLVTSEAIKAGSTGCTSASRRSPAATASAASAAVVEAVDADTAAIAATDAASVIAPNDRAHTASDAIDGAAVNRGSASAAPSSAVRAVEDAAVAATNADITTGQGERLGLEKREGDSVCVSDDGDAINAAHINRSRSRCCCKSCLLGLRSVDASGEATRNLLPCRGVHGG